MLPKYHLVLGFIFSAIATFLFKFDLIYFLVLFVSTWVFDVDHYFIYIIKKKDFSLGKAYRYMVGVRKMDRKQQFLFILKDNKILLFHTLEFILLFSLLITGISYGLGLSKMYLYLYLAGMGFHLVLDIFMEKTYKEKYSIVLFMIAKKKYNLG